MKYDGENVCPKLNALEKNRRFISDRIFFHRYKEKQMILLNFKNELFLKLSFV